MLPEKMKFSDKTIQITTIPSNTFKIDFDKNRVRNLFDGIEALKQAIYKILITERYKYEIYDWNYGIELEDLIGMPKGYVKAEAERRIREALLQDDRIEDIYKFDFYDLEKDKTSILAVFYIKSIFGEFSVEMEVKA